MTDYYEDFDNPYRPAPDSTEARRSTPWHLMDNNTLIYAYNLLALHQSPFLNEVMDEVNNRMDDKQWIDIDNPPPLLGDVPRIFHYWPFSLLWRQKSR